ncbi:MAG: pentapeptide repeat-containing protein [Cyanobacteria bacterium P01_F01_bin.4]
MGITFINRDLRNRSFYKQDLRDAVFDHCDLRGCDFRYAQLQGTTFQQVQFGIARRRLLAYGAIALGVAVVAFNAISHMVFGILGLTAQDPAWGFAIALYVSLAIAGLVAVPKHRLPRPMRRLAILSNIATGALLGFYYGGSAAGEDPQVAIIAACLAGGSVGLICLARPQSNGFVGLMTIVGAMAAYGMVFAAMGMTSASLSTGYLLMGMGWGACALLYFVLALKALENSYQALKKAASTQFQNTDLSQTIFDEMSPAPRLLS